MNLVSSQILTAFLENIDKRNNFVITGGGDGGIRKRYNTRDRNMLKQNTEK